VQPYARPDFASVSQ